MATYKYFQPEYVRKFQCDGQACSALCCCQNWRIDVDKETYKNYFQLEPKSASQEIIRNIKIDDELNAYVIQPNENNKCPFLTNDNLCSLQKKYGEKFLSVTCATYPRTTWDIGNFYERSLTLTCPVAAKLILLATEPLKFEKIEVSEKIHSNFGKIVIRKNEATAETLEIFLSIQETAIAILQERSLTIDQRLLMFGLYCDKIDELLNNNMIDDIEKFNPIYQDTNFRQEQAAHFSAVLRFNAHEYIEIMLGLLEKLYGEGNVQTPEDKKYIDAVIKVLQIKTDENNFVKISALSQRYTKLGEERQKFLNRFEKIFENYLVNELFLNLYPFRFKAPEIVDSCIFNYGIFVAAYKILELLTLSLFITNENFDESDLVKAISWYEQNINHNIGYLDKIASYFGGRKNVLDTMQSMLQV